MGNKCSKSQRHLILDQINHSFCDLRANVRNRHKCRINDLDDHILSMIFTILPLSDKLIIERVCKRWQYLMRQLFLKNSVSIKLGEHSLKCHCHCPYWINWSLPPLKSFERDSSGYICYPNSLIKHLFTNCFHLKCLNFSHCYLNNQSLNIIVRLGQQLQCLHLYDIRLEDNNNCRQQWKVFARKVGQQLTHLSIGGLQSLDVSMVDTLLKNCVCLEELNISNEIDITSYLAIIRQTVKRIFINCEHGLSLQCISLLSQRNDAEKVIHLGRVDVEPEMIDSVISTIGSNFSNLKRLGLRLRSDCDLDVMTPAELLFTQLDELSLQFVSKNADKPFLKIISLGWTTIKCLTIQYASFTRHSVIALTQHVPQLHKLVLHAIEFRCDHQSKRYGHRLCVECGRYCWQSLALNLKQLSHLRLHRAIIDSEILFALEMMSSLRHLDLHYCSNVNQSVVSVCCALAARDPQHTFTLFVVSRAQIRLTADDNTAANNTCASNHNNNNRNFILDIRDYNRSCDNK